MSDFDKEAERQKLREKYADDEDDRAATQRMSQLLLQGATMTNHHCEECGDPRFRYEGREFCPSCEGVQGGTPVQETGEEAAKQDTQDTRDQSAGTTQHPGPTDETGDQSTAEQPAVEATDASQLSGQQPQSEAPARGHAPQQAPERGSSPSEGPIDGDLAEARRTLARSVRSLAERGATADDPRRAREHLEAAREAAEALAALNR